jgi:sulfatase modifying factor 1
VATWFSPTCLALSAISVLITMLPSVRAGAQAAVARSTSASALPSASVLTLHEPGTVMVRIAAGPAIVGSSANEVLEAAASCAREPLAHRCSEQTFANELGRRTLSLRSFWIDRTEVRVADFARCVAVGRCRAPAFAAGGRRFERKDYPVSLVSFEQASAYCRYRGARLPSEIEFERAARGVAGRAYPWGELYNRHVSNHGRFAVSPNDASDGFPELAPVGSFPDGRTPDGILDLAGNVAEWQADAYRERYSDPPPVAGEPARRVIRGGSFVRGAAWLRGAAREGAAPETARPDVGFRCARSAAETSAP